MSGYSPGESLNSKYLCMIDSKYYDFFTVHRMDKEIWRDMKGMSEEEQRTCLMEYTGQTDETPDHESTNILELDEEELKHPFR